MFVAVDVHYLPTGGARAAAVVAADVTFGDLLADWTAHVPEVRPCRPGQFYLRELPPLHVVLDDLQHMRLLVVDGYADLDPAGRPGLGAHAHAEFGVPVIGVAKTAFRTASHAVPVLRGEGSTRRCMSQPPGCFTDPCRGQRRVWMTDVVVREQDRWTVVRSHASAGTPPSRRWPPFSQAGLNGRR